MNRLRLTALVTSVALFAACSGGAEVTPAPTLEGRTFLSTRVEGQALAPGTRVRISFQDGGLNASAGCNTMGGRYRVEAGRLGVPELAMTEMACQPPLMDQDRWLAQLLTAGAAVGLDAETLTLEGSAVRLTLVDREVADPDRPLEGTRWVVEGIVSGGAVSSVPVGVTAAITIANGRAEVEAGCNAGGAPVELGDGSLAFGQLVLTKKLCDPAVMSVEEAVGAVLAGRVAYAIEADTLTLDAGGRGLILRAAP